MPWSLLYQVSGDTKTGPLQQFGKWEQVGMTQKHGRLSGQGRVMWVRELRLVWDCEGREKDQRKETPGRDWRLELALSQHLLDANCVPGIVRKKDGTRELLEMRH